MPSCHLYTEELLDADTNGRAAAPQPDQILCGSTQRRTHLSGSYRRRDAHQWGGEASGSRGALSAGSRRPRLREPS